MGPARARVMRTLMQDPDPELAWHLTSAHGTREDWLEFALSPHRPPELRGLALSHLAEGTEEQRYELVTRLLTTPLLHRAACELLAGLRGEGAELAWLALLAHAEDTVVTERIVARLAEIGTSRSLAPLHALRERTGLMRFHLRGLTELALREIRERSGATPGALSVAELPTPGALSVPAKPGRLGVAPRSGS
jgi:hypothetical protein